MPVVGLGTDIVQVARISESRHLQALAQRILTSCELEQMRAHKQPGRFLAKRYAAKEAAVKALGTGIAQGVGFQQIHIEHDPLGKPLLRFSEAAKERAKLMGVTATSITISDERDYAVATVILESE